MQSVNPLSSEKARQRHTWHMDPFFLKYKKVLNIQFRVT